MFNLFLKLYLYLIKDQLKSLITCLQRRKKNMHVEIELYKILKCVCLNLKRIYDTKKKIRTQGTGTMWTRSWEYQAV